MSDRSPPLLGGMQHLPLTLDRVIEHAARWHGHREIVARRADRSLARTTWRAVRDRAAQLSNALRAAGVREGDRIATLALNGIEHLESWYGIMGMGAVCHTLNPRLFDDQLAYIVNHARDRWILADGAFAPILARILPRCPGVERVVFYSSPAASVNAATLDYEALIAGHTAEADWGSFPELAAAGLCYTSGTTGDPKGVLYSHRSNMLHALMSTQLDAIGLGANDVVLPIVPMFHANAWGLVFAVPAVGAKMVLPGAHLDGASICDLLDNEGVTISAGVPTVWQAALQYMEGSGRRPTKLRRVVIGGAACPPSLIQIFQDRYGVEVFHAWGMTEMSPIGTIGSPLPEHAALDADALVAVRARQGRTPFMVDMKITDANGARLPHDGIAVGHLKVRGDAVIDHYFSPDGTVRPVLDDEGYFDTGDIASIDALGYMQITDRAKDVIKSGGEWISSIEIENLVAGHPKVALAAVIAKPDPKWTERPLLIVKLKPGERAQAAELLTFLEGKISRWWMPDEVRFVEEIPLGATGKLDKKKLRAVHLGS